MSNLFYTQRQLEIFLTLVECGSMTRTAEKLNMTQPAVSQCIAEMERNLGVRLFDRFRRRLSLTYGGEIFYDSVRRINALYLETGFQMEAVAGMQRERLRIGASMTLGSYILPDCLRNFSHRHPGIELEVMIDNTARIEAGLLDNRLDIAVIEGFLESPDLIRHDFRTDYLSLVCGPEHPWAGRNEVDAAELAEEPFILREEGSGTRARVEGLFNRHTVAYRPQHTVNSIEGIKKMVSAGIGIAALPRIAIQEECARGELCSFEIRNVELSRKFCYALHKDKGISPVLDAWIDSLSAYADG